MRSTHIRKVLHSFLCITCCLTFSVQGVRAEASAKVLTLLNWSDYMDPGLLEKFERQHGIRVRESIFDSDDGRTRMLIATEGEEFDLAVIDGNSLEGYLSRGWLAPVCEKRIPNLGNIEPKWRSAHEGAEQYAVPYFWGTTGIAYRRDLVPEPISSWMQLFKPLPELRGRIYMLPQNRELLDIALKALGHSINTENEDDYREARDLLLAQKPYVKKYDFLAFTDTSAILDGTIVAAPTYSGDALTLKALDDRIEYVTPKEGGVLWVDYLVIMAKSKHIESAEKFINFLNEPENAAQLAQFVSYASPNRGAERLLPQEFLDDTTMYPPPEVLQRYEIDTRLPAKICRIRSTIFAQVTSGKI